MISAYVKTCFNTSSVKCWVGLVGLFLANLAYGAGLVNDVIHHELDVTLKPATSNIAVVDNIRLPSSISDMSEISFILHNNMTVKVNGKLLQKMERVSEKFKSFTKDPTTPIAEYRLKRVPGETLLSLSYAGAINQPASKQKEESARSFSQTSGVISSEGIFSPALRCGIPYLVLMNE